MTLTEILKDIVPLPSLYDFRIYLNCSISESVALVGLCKRLVKNNRIKHIKLHDNRMILYGNDISKTVTLYRESSLCCMFNESKLNINNYKDIINL
jgi:hypothetical protein